MRKKDDLAIEKIIECAKTEFLEKDSRARLCAGLPKMRGILPACFTEDLPIKANFLKRSLVALPTALFLF